MIFESLSEKLQNVFKKLKGKGKLSEKDVKKAMREVKLALLEADVNFKVVKKFINRVTERAVGQEVMKSLTPGQQVIKIVRDELTDLMGKTNSQINYSSGGITVILLVGLQGAGKTTTAGKLAYRIKKEGHYPLLVAADVYRPAAVKQLQVVGEKADVPVFTMGEKNNPVDIVKASISFAKNNGRDVVLVDTAGRLHIDEAMMEELHEMKKAVNPHEILLVVDAMTGQDAVNVAESFNEKLGIDGVILTKLDGDTRGGAAISVKAVTRCPIKFVGTGEKLEEIEPFYPDRMASRILGMGDVLSLIEKAEQTIDKEKALQMGKKLRSQEFTFEDFLDQLEQVKKMGPINQLLEMIPGLNKNKLKGLNVDDKELDKIQAIINSMTKEERRNPSIINGSRRRRIAKGSGTSVQDVNRLIKQFNQTKKMIKKLKDMEKGFNRMNMPFFR